MKYKLLLITSFISLFVGGFYIIYNSSDQFIPVYPESQNGTLSSSAREPSAIRNSYDFSSMEGAKFSQATKERLLNGAEILTGNNSIGIELGHFVMKNHSGEKIFACKKYSKMVLSFNGEKQEGQGVIIDGQLPKMEVEGPCELGKDINKISPLWIPVAKILNSPVSDGEFDIRENQKTLLIRFSSLPGEWIHFWTLNKIRMYDPEHPEDEIVLDPNDISSILKKPLVMRF